MNILKCVKSNISKFVLDLGYTGDFSVGFPSDEKYGDIYTNVAMVSASFFKKKPIEIANEIADFLRKNSDYVSVSVVAPGFINMKVSDKVWDNLLNYVRKNKDSYGSSNIGNGEVVNLEFVSANPTGPMHIGHARGAVVGDTIGNLLQKIGYKVDREYYINDNGSQIDKLVESAYLRCIEVITGISSDEFINRNDLYPGDYLMKIASILVKKHSRIFESNMQKSEVMDLIRDDLIDAIMALIMEDLLLLGIKHDIFTSEKRLNDSGVIENSIQLLTEKELIYSGVAEEPKSEKSSSDWMVREQKLFASSKFGDDVDRCIQKEDKSWTYFAGDIAYHFDKISRGYRKMIIVLGVDHAGYVKRLKAIVTALSNGVANIDVILYGLVKFIDKGEPVKMSKRRGAFLTVRDLVENIGKDATRFMMVMCGNEQMIDFDLSVVLEHSKDNPVFYVQYAHARIYSVLRNASKLGLSVDAAKTSLISSKEEMLLVKIIARFPSVVENAAINSEPHKIAFYLLELAEAFHSLWGCGTVKTDMKFIQEGDPILTSARLSLIEAVAYVISSGLKLFSIEPVFEM